MADPTDPRVAQAGVTDPTVTPPLDVKDSALLPIVMTVIRYLLTAFGAYLVTKGWLNDETANDVIGGLLIVLPTVIGGWLSRHNNEKLKLLERFVPNDIARRV